MVERGASEAEWTRTAPGSPHRPRAVVIAWDVGHNPLGRAHVLAQVLEEAFAVEIWGAQFDAYGSRVWAPLRDSTIPIRTFPGRRFPEHLDAMERVASEVDARLLWVSKPRLPSLALGVLAREGHDRLLVVDVDDDELAFFGEAEPRSPRRVRRAGARADDGECPYGLGWTRLATSLVRFADEVTTSNGVLQRRHGGLLVPHARDERVFDPARYDRVATRRRLGVGDDDRLVLFGGTPRVHKGVRRTLEALERLGDRRYKLAVFGTPELGSSVSGLGSLESWILRLPLQRFGDLAPIVAAADLACVLQDVDHPVSRSQMPAKVTDALAMEVPCIVSDVPPLRPLIDAEVVHVAAADEPLEDRIRAVLDDPRSTMDRARRGREVFLSEYSLRAVRAAVVPRFEGRLDHVPPMAPELRSIVEIPRRRFGRGRRPSPEVIPPRRPGGLDRRARPGDVFDLVVFWRQHDSFLYGRRQDMLLEALARSGRFERIVHFDQPISPEALVHSYLAGSGRADQRRLVARRTLARVLRRRSGRRWGPVRCHIYLHGGRWTQRLGVPHRDGYVEFVRGVLARHGFGSRPVAVLAYPANEDVPEIVDALDPELVIADVVDDQRLWHVEGSLEYDRVERNHEEILARSDIVLANCAPVAERIEHLAPGRVTVVPNGCELPGPASDEQSRPRRPRSLRSIGRPVVGYAGNLSSRLDVPLLEAVVRARPAWSFVFIGSAHLDRTALRLAAAPNVHFLGVQPYEEAKQTIAHFDVGIIPHLDDAMTRSMHPLKAFVYAAAGIPVVATPVANLDELTELITVAAGADAFEAAIEAAIEAGHRDPDPEVLAPHAWDARADLVLDIVDRALEPEPQGW